MSIIKRVVRKSLLLTYGKTNTAKMVHFGPLRGYKWIYSSGYSSYWMGDYESVIAEAFIKEVRKSSCIYDLGANLGFYTLMASKFKKPGGEVHAFEPIPSNFEILQEHIKANQLKSTFGHNLAISDSEGKIAFSNSENTVANTYIKDSHTFRNSEQIQVDTLSLDTFIRQNNNRIPEILKIDVEGAELDVIKGGEALFKNKHPVIFLSTHNCHLPGIHRECLDYLHSFDYKFHYFDHHERKSEYDDPWYDLIAY